MALWSLDRPWRRILARSGPPLVEFDPILSGRSHKCRPVLAPGRQPPYCCQATPGFSVVPFSSHRRPISQSDNPQREFRDSAAEPTRWMRQFSPSTTWSVRLGWVNSQSIHPALCVRYGRVAPQWTVIIIQLGLVHERKRDDEYCYSGATNLNSSIQGSGRIGRKPFESLEGKIHAFRFVWFS